MKYEEIYSRFYHKITDPSLFDKYSKEEAYEMFVGWIKSTASQSYIRRKFFTLTFNDDLEELTFNMVSSIDEDSDKDFVIEIFAQGMAICWLKKEVDSITNSAKLLGTKEEKMILNNYKPNIERLKEMELELKKFVRDYGYSRSSLGGA